MRQLHLQLERRPPLQCHHPPAQVHGPGGRGLWAGGTPTVPPLGNFRHVGAGRRAGGTGMSASWPPRGGGVQGPAPRWCPSEAPPLDLKTAGPAGCWSSQPGACALCGRLRRGLVGRVAAGSPSCLAPSALRSPLCCAPGLLGVEVAGCSQLCPCDSVPFRVSVGGGPWLLRCVRSRPVHPPVWCGRWSCPTHLTSHLLVPGPCSST